MSVDVDIFETDEFKSNDGARQSADAQVTQLSREIAACQPSCPKALMDKFQAAVSLRRTSSITVFKGVAESLKIDGSFFDDANINGDLTNPADQPQWDQKTAEGQAKLANAKAFVDKMQPYADAWDAKLAKYVNADTINGIIKDCGLKLDANGNLSGNMKLLYERIAETYANSGAKKEWYDSTFAKALGWAILAAVIGVGIGVAIHMFKGALCAYAKTESGCFWYPPDGSDPQPVAVSNSPPPNCFSYDTCCGGCDDGSLQAACYGTICCSQELDPNTTHKGGTWSYVCKSPMSVPADWWNDLVHMFSPGNIEKYLEIIGIAVGGILLAYLLYIILKAVSARASGSHSEEKG